MKTGFVSRMRHLVLAGAMLFPTTLARAGDSTPIEPRSTTQAITPRPYPPEVFDDLKRAEDPKLASQRAGYYDDYEHHYYYYHRGISGAEIVLCVLLLIFLFPIGVIVTIVIVLTD